MQSQQAGPEQQTVQQEQRDQIQTLLNQLAPLDRQMVVLRYWYDYSYEEIAEMTETTVSAVKSRLHRTRSALAQRIATTPALARSAAVLVEN